MGFMIGIFALLLISMLLVVKYCSKRLKIILSAIIILVTCYCVITSIDMNRVHLFRKPIFVWETNNRSGVSVNEVPFQGVGIK